ncbi:hypothetical protein E9549_20925 [Blastococcus sp. MG754426]|uniref:hypothetical protein n=1 Tax=unclassified Blastococcus TaxID=2619396 RepID=UPI001EEFE443|nr:MULTISPECIES: hypothetical protein [unclassified Blastococcus]MCF6509832.1 hypothetical protein [Blastococcus sp. MG754426]MCF6514423.1 hypothetical protein [Blastococcus sp. MG754427]MCF6737482.1 hypothetical protein [Blastococcus sp. KM273129]
MDRRRTALVLLLLFALCSGVAIVVSGSRPASEQGLAPAFVQFAGYALALAAAVLLLSSPGDGPRRVGGLVLVVLLALVVLDLIAPGSPNIGAGLVHLAGLVVIMVATVRLALGIAGEHTA